jgi:hypothetical protein
MPRPSGILVTDLSYTPARGGESQRAHTHFIIQRSRQFASLSGTPEARRAGHLLIHHLDPAIRTARLASRLKIHDDKTKSWSTTLGRVLINPGRTAM